MIDPTNSNSAVSTAFVEELERCGVRRAFVSPGSRSSPLALALWRNDSIGVTVVLDERSGAFAALGSALADGIPALVLCTSGSAAANLHPAVVEADQAAVGLLLVTADRPPELRDIGAGQTVDQVKIFGGSTRWYFELAVTSADDAGLIHARSVACRAFARAAGDPRPGPVHVNVPLREPLAPVADPGAVSATDVLARDGRGDRPLVAFSRRPAPASASVARRIAAAVAGCPTLILAGRRPPGAPCEAIHELAEAAAVPLLAEPTSQLATPGRRMLVRAYDGICAAQPAALAPRVVIRFGDFPTSKATRAWLGSMRDAEQIIVDPGHGFVDPGQAASLVVRCDEEQLANALGEALDGARADEPFTAAWLDAEREAQAAIDAELSRTQPQISEPSAHRALSALYGPGSRVYTASSMPIRDQEAFARPCEAVFLCNRGANGIDGLVSSGAGAALATGETTWIVVGDLGLDHDIAGLALAARVEGDLRLIVLNNGGGGIFEHLPLAGSIAREEFEALFATPQSRSVAAAASWAGLSHRRVDSIEDLVGAAGSRGLVEVAVDRHEDPALRARVKARVAEAISR